LVGVVLEHVGLVAANSREASVAKFAGKLAEALVNFVDVAPQALDGDKRLGADVTEPGESSFVHQLDVFPENLGGFKNFQAEVAQHSLNVGIVVRHFSSDFRIHKSQKCDVRI